MTQPRISVITPCLNNARFVERTICSVLDQGYERLEYIVVDGGSTDGTQDILDIYRAEMAACIVEPDHGPADAINKGLAQATGEIVTILSAEDLCLPGTLDAVADAMCEDGGPDWIVGCCQRIDEDDSELGALSPTSPSSLSAFLMHNSGALPGASSYYRRRLFDRLGGFDARMRLSYDYEFQCRLLAEGLKPRVLPIELTAKREYAGRRSSIDTLERGKEYIAAARKYAARMPFSRRMALWRNCDARERIYTLAQAELTRRSPRRFLLQQLLTHPWWVADHAVRDSIRRAA